MKKEPSYWKYALITTLLTFVIGFATCGQNGNFKKEHLDSFTFSTMIFLVGSVLLCSQLIFFIYRTKNQKYYYDLAHYAWKTTLTMLLIGLLIGPGLCFVSFGDRNKLAAYIATFAFEKFSILLAIAFFTSIFMSIRSNSSTQDTLDQIDDVDNQNNANNHNNDDLPKS